MHNIYNMTTSRWNNRKYQVTNLIGASGRACDLSDRVYNGERAKSQIGLC